MAVELGRVDARMLFLEPVDLGDGFVRQDAGAAAVGARGGKERVQAVGLVAGFPFLQGLIAVGHGAPVRKRQGFFRNAAVVSGRGSMGKEPLDDRGDQCEAEPCDLSGELCVISIIFHGKYLPQAVFLQDRGKARRSPSAGRVVRTKRCPARRAAGQAEAFADPFDGAPGQEACCEEGQDENGVVNRIRDEVIRKDG